MDQQAWYRQTWPWVLILIPFTAVLVGIAIVSIALIYPDDLVIDNYYQEGKSINLQKEMDTNAARMGITAKAVVRADNPLEFDINNAVDSVVLLRVFHVTDKAKDISIALYPEGEGRYTSKDPVPAVLMGKGVWYVALEGVDDQWRLRERITTPASVLELSADE